MNPVAVAVGKALGRLFGLVGVGRRRENLLFLLRILAATSIAVACNAIYEWPTHPALRPPGLVGNPEFLSNYLLFGAISAVGLMLVERRREWATLAGLAAASIDLADVPAALDQLKALDERKADLVSLRVFWGASMEEIADILDSNSNTVMTRLFRARSKLKDYFDSEHIRH